MDLHVHSDNSDGELNVIEILEKAEIQGLKYLSITDHDTVRAYSRIDNIDISKYYKGKLIKGIEVAFLYNGVVMELLGYDINIDKIKKSEYIDNSTENDRIQIQTSRLEYMKRVCDRLKIVYDKELIIEAANNQANDIILDSIIKYDENKEILTPMGIVDRNTFYRSHYICKDSPFYVVSKAELPNIKQVSDMIRNADGKCFLAHMLKYPIDNQKETLNEIIRLNVLDGIECYHQHHSKQQAEYLETVCDINNLMKSGGSDSHRKNDKLGYYNKYKEKIPYTIIKGWREN